MNEDKIDMTDGMEFSISLDNDSGLKGLIPATGEEAPVEGIGVVGDEASVLGAPLSWLPKATLIRSSTMASGSAASSSEPDGPSAAINRTVSSANIRQGTSLEYSWGLASRYRGQIVNMRFPMGRRYIGMSLTKSHTDWRISRHAWRDSSRRRL